MDTSIFWLIITANVTFLFTVYCNIAHSLPSSTDIDYMKAKYLPSDYVRTNFTLNDVKRLLRQKCKKAGIKNSHIYDNIEAVTTELLQCAGKIGNFTEILSEIEEARPVGELDVVFQKYCDKQPQAEQCLQNFNAHLLPCLTVEERAQNTIMMRIVSSLLGFLCNRNGDPIAIFIAEEGPECFEKQKENIGKCINATYESYMRKNGQTKMLNEMTEFVLTKKECIDLYDFEECILSYLEQCNEITPANIIESMFKYVKNETKCDMKTDEMKMEKHSGAITVYNFNFNYTFELCIAIIVSFSILN